MVGMYLEKRSYSLAIWKANSRVWHMTSTDTWLKQQNKDRKWLMNKHFCNTKEISETMLESKGNGQKPAVIARGVPQLI